jgi:hypothetical protein
LANVVFKEGITLPEARAALSGLVHRATEAVTEAAHDPSETVGRLGGGIARAMQEWFVEGWLYIVLMSVAIGIVLGYGSMFVIRFSLRRYVFNNPFIRNMFTDPTSQEVDRQRESPALAHSPRSKLKPGNVDS